MRFHHHNLSLDTDGDRVRAQEKGRGTYSGIMAGEDSVEFRVDD
jgi:hypothetical protein